jgi:hypothetical protein
MHYASHYRRRRYILTLSHASLLVPCSGNPFPGSSFSGGPIHVMLRKGTRPALLRHSSPRHLPMWSDLPYAEQQGKLSITTGPSGISSPLHKSHDAGGSRQRWYTQTLLINASLPQNMILPWQALHEFPSYSRDASLDTNLLSTQRRH